MTISKDKYFKLLDDEILEDGVETFRVVDYKWLSAQCSVNVNVAKQYVFFNYYCYNIILNNNIYHVS